MSHLSVPRGFLTCYRSVNSLPQWKAACMVTRHSSSNSPATSTQQPADSQVKESIHPTTETKHFQNRKLKTPIKTDEDDSIPIAGVYAMPHPIWEKKEVDEVKVTHKPPSKFADRLAIAAMTAMRVPFDAVSGYNKEPRTETMWINRVCFLETLAGVPGMVAAMIRHLTSLRLMRRDHGWIHTLLEEAENERMHLMTALQLKHPSYLFRMGVVGTQGIFVFGFSLAYLMSPNFCHRFVGYLEEEAVATYTKLLKDMEEGGSMYHWNFKKAPAVAIEYWELGADATMKDVILHIRADEAHHRGVNHTMASMGKRDFNPYKPGE